MKAVVFYENGSPDVLKLVEIVKPTPADDEVLIKVCAASVNPLDWRVMRGGPFLLRILARGPKMKQPGVDVAGVVEAVGKSVTRFKVGDAVFGSCKGSFAEYTHAQESKLARKPENVTFEDAASLPVAGLTALQGLRDNGRIQPGQEVLINGASGGVGTFAVQIAKSFGAEVTGVCGTRNVEFVKSLGADRVIDYTREDFTETSERYDILFDNMGNHPLLAYRRILKPKGRCVIVGGPKSMWPILGHALQAVVLSWFVSQKLGMMLAKVNSEDLAKLGELMQSGKVKAVIDRRYSLSEVPQAMAYAEEGHTRGKVVISVS
jgi:NADPH:quinone reductase-like Zn-dependent oxidoreductase